MDEVCESLDKLTLKTLELMEEKVYTTVQMENLIREGHIDLAKARYIRGKESIGGLQLPNEDEEIVTLFDLQTDISEDDANSVPRFNISLKNSTNNKEDIQDPIKRFGILVPQNLRTAQKRFQESLYLGVKTANVSAELLNVQNELRRLLAVKRNLLEDAK